MKSFRFTVIFLGLTLIIFACAPAQATTTSLPPSTTPDWFDMELTDAQTGETFTMNDYAGKVVLLETMAIWCPNCVVQANEVRNLHAALGNPEDLISVSLDVDLNEDQAALKEYASHFKIQRGWYFLLARSDACPTSYFLRRRAHGNSKSSGESF